MRNYVDEVDVRERNARCKYKWNEWKLQKRSDFELHINAVLSSKIYFCTYMYMCIRNWWIRRVHKRGGGRLAVVWGSFIFDEMRNILRVLPFFITIFNYSAYSSTVILALSGCIKVRLSVSWDLAKSLCFLANNFYVYIYIWFAKFAAIAFNFTYLTLVERVSV